MTTKELVVSRMSKIALDVLDQYPDAIISFENCLYIKNKNSINYEDIRIKCKIRHRNRIAETIDRIPWHVLEDVAKDQFFWDSITKRMLLRMHDEITALREFYHEEK
jgi:hypothetical protein